MRYPVYAVLVAFSLALCAPLADAQDMAVSFEDLPRVLKSGNIIYVTDSAGLTTLGTVTKVSGSSVTVAVMHVARGHGETTVTIGKERIIDDSVIVRISRSDKFGKEQALVYPPSWDTVDSLPQGTEVAIVLKNGEKRRSRFRGATSGTIQLSEVTGKDETLAKDRIQRIVRKHANDPTINGIGVGAAISGGVSALMLGTLAAECGFSCGTGSDATGVAIGVAMMAGIGAGVGWAIDKAHKGTEQVFPAPSTGAIRVDVAPLIGAGKGGAQVSLRFR